MKVYSVTIEAFGRIRVTNIEAKDEADALDKARAAVGYREAVKATKLDHTHTGAVTR